MLLTNSKLAEASLNQLANDKFRHVETHATNTVYTCLQLHTTHITILSHDLLVIHFQL